jgi:hypothetical protein
MKKLGNSGLSSLYQLTPFEAVDRYIITTPESRAISNDPLVFGVEYTKKLEASVTSAFQLLKEASVSVGDETHALILHILRGGINFGIRDALHNAYGWSGTSSAFISSQRFFSDAGGWQISEDSYRKMPEAHSADLIFGDVVATGVSLRHALNKLIEQAHELGQSYRSITFFTIGGDEAEKIVSDAAKRCKQFFPDFQGARVLYIEGIFGVPEKDSPLSIAIPGTDLLRNPAILAPEFIDSQKASLSYALERCTIYDAGSRAFEPKEYLKDVIEYWEKVLALAENGMNLATYLLERFPADVRNSDPDFVREQSTEDSLKNLADTQLQKLHAKLHGN